MVNDRQLREQNRRSWNAVVPAHESHRLDQAAFFQRGGLTLFPEERELLGDVAHRSVVHLLCNTGQDTLSLAQLGAIVTGVDISDVAIERARQLAAESNIAAAFECMDVYDWLQKAAKHGQRFDIVYAAYGVVCWLHDLQQWAQGIASVLNAGGRFVLVEFHPVSNMLNADWQLTAAYPTGGRRLLLDGVGDYVGASLGGLTPGGYHHGVQNFHNPEPCHLFRWGLAEVVMALIKAGLTIEGLHEYPYVNGEHPFNDMQQIEGRRLLPPSHVPSMPLMYGLAARKGALVGDPSHKQ